MSHIFESRPPIPNEPVELIPPRVAGGLAFWAATIALGVFAGIAIPVCVFGQRSFVLFGGWLHRTFDPGPAQNVWAILPIAAVLAITVLAHEVVHLVIASRVGRVAARLSVYRSCPAVFWYGSLSRRASIAVLLAPVALLGILPLAILPYLPAGVATMAYLVVSFNVIGSRMDIVQALYIARRVPPGARIWCHPDGLGWSVPMVEHQHTS